MFRAILSKEYLKVRYIFLGLIILFFAGLFYVYLDLVKSFAAVEPHSMMWYEAIHIGNIYYEDLKFFPSIAAIVIALAQFLPEIHKNKFRIPLHLPINQNKMVLLYLSVGFLLLLVLNIVLVGLLYFISLKLYPNLVALNVFTTVLPWVLASFVLYIGTSSIMIEPYWKRKGLLMVLFFLISAIFFTNSSYGAYENVSLILFALVGFTLFIPLLVLYRFKNGDFSLLSEKSLIPKFAYGAFVVLSIFILSFWIPKTYKGVVKDNSLASYVFYSPTQKRFIYKQHFGNHNFIFGDSKDNIFTRKEFEEGLPFTYWRNLETQNKLPIVVDGREFHKKEIKAARQSFKIEPTDLFDHKKQIEIYPLFNPSSKKGMIAFPEMMFSLKDRFTVYQSEPNGIDETLSIRYTKLLQDKGFTFPAKIIAGKTTNIKPLDEGYFIVDAKDKLFHMKKYDDTLYLNEVSLDKKIKIRHIKISESRKKEFYGSLLGEDNSLYLITYDNYKLVKLPLKGYNPDIMTLQIFADPISKTIRYQDDKQIHAIGIDKEYNLLDTFTVSIPQINPLYKNIFEYIFPFYIEQDIYKSFESYRIMIGSYKAYIISALLALLYIAFLYFRKKDIKSHIMKIVFVFLTGVFGVIFLLLE